MGYAVKGQYLSFSGVIQETPDTTYGTTYTTPLDPDTPFAFGANTGIANFSLVERRFNVGYRAVGLGPLTLHFWVGRRGPSSLFLMRPYYIQFYPANFGISSWIGQTVDITLDYTLVQPGSSAPRVSLRLNGVLQSSPYYDYNTVSADAMVLGARPGDPIGLRYAVVPDFTFNPVSAGYFQFPGASVQGLVSLNTATVSSVFSSTNATSNFKNSQASLQLLTTATVSGNRIIATTYQFTATTQITAAVGPVILAQANLQNDTQIPGDSYLEPDYLNPFEDVELLENYVDEQYFDGSYVAGGSISYTLPDYAESDYFIGAKTKGYYFPIFDPSIILGGVAHTSTEFTVTATPEFVVGGAAQLASEFDIAPQGNVTYDDTANLESEFVVDEATENIFYGTATIESAFAVTESVGLVFDIQAASTASTQLSSTATNIIDLASTYAGQNYADPTYFDDTAPFTLLAGFTSTFSASNEVIPSANIQGSADITVVGGYLQTAGTVNIDSTGSFTISPYITGGTGVIIGSTVSANTASSTVAASVNLAIAANTAIVTEFTQSADAGNPIIAGSTLITTFAQALQFDLFRGTTIPASAEFTQTALAGYRHFGQASIDSLGFVLAAGKILIIDEYYLLVVSPETRTLNALVEPRLIPVSPETAILKVLPDITDILVEPETRRLRIPLAPAVAVGNRTRRLS